MKTPTAREERLAREAREGLNEQIAKGLAHPLRVRILGVLSERDASASEIAKEIREEPSLVAYHSRVLQDHDLVRVVAVRPTRGAPKVLRATTESLFSDEVWAGLNLHVRAGISRETIENLGRKINDAFRDETFDARIDRHLSHQTVRLDWAGWDEVSAILAETMNRVREIADRVADSAADTDALAPVTVGLLSFESPRMYESAPRVP